MDLTDKCPGYLYVTVCFVLTFVDVFSSSTTTTTPKPNGSQHLHAGHEDKSFPVWLIGVIILSCLGMVILVGTIVQKVMQKRAERNEQYRMAS